METAVEHPDGLDEALAALRSGRVSWSHAAALVHEYAGVPPEAASAVEGALLPVAMRTTTTKLAYQARRLRNHHHPEVLDERARSAGARRRVEMDPADDAMAWLSVYLPATSASAIDAHLTAAARHLQRPAEARTLAQLRTDVFVDLLLPCDGRSSGPETGVDVRASAGAACACGSSTDRRGGPDSLVTPPGPSGATPLPDSLRAHINVTVPVLSLLGVDDAPALLEGYGPIAAELARRLAAHAPSFTRLPTHPETGAVLSVGRTTYTVPADLKKWLRVRDRTCRHPGCSIPAARCELDHTRPWAHDGPTDADNLAHLCRKHHAFKSEGLCHYDQPRPGVLTATSAGGRTYTTENDDPPFRSSVLERSSAHASPRRRPDSV